MNPACLTQFVAVPIMSTMSEYERMAKAITFVVERADEQPSLAQIAEHVHLSPWHFQRLFSRWVGVTPKRFLQTVTLERSKPLLLEPGSLLDVSQELGLSSGSRLYDHYVTLEAVTPGEHRSRGQGLNIVYGTHLTPFGRIFVAATARGICRAAFLDYVPLEQTLADLKAHWPLAEVSEDASVTAPLASQMFVPPGAEHKPLSLHVSGSNFQVMVWRALLRILPGAVVSYSGLAAGLGRPTASRAVASAVAANPVAFVIPCHRVIQKSGALGGYRWGPARKQTMYWWERVRAQTEETG